jgi:hypothetical protein
MTEHRVERPLEGRVVVVTDVAAARAVGEGGATVVMVSTSPEAAAALAQLERDGHRVALFVGELAESSERAALSEMLAELFP